MPTLVDIAGGPKGDGLKKQIEAGKYPGIVKTTLDGVDQRDYLEGKSDSARDYFFYYSGSHPLGGSLQELEVLLCDGADYVALKYAQRDSLTPRGKSFQRTSNCIPCTAVPPINYNFALGFFHEPDATAMHTKHRRTRVPSSTFVTGASA